MHSYQIPGLRFSGIAGAAIPQHRFVTINSTGKVVVCADSAATAIIGVSNTDAKANEVIDMYDGIVQVNANEALNPGDFVKAAAEGKAAKGEAATTVGTVLTKAAKDELVTIKLG